MQKYKPLILLFVALILSGLAAYSSVKYLNFKETQIASAYNTKNNFQKVLVPKSDIEIGQVLTASTLALRPIPSEYIPDGALTADDFDKIVGMVVKTHIGKGKVITRGSIQGVNNIDKFSDLLKQGQRALTLKVSALDSNENMLRPGDKIDILLQKIDKENKTKTSEISLILEKVAVLATGEITIADNQFTQKGFEGYSSITIGVKSEEIDKILVSKEAGTLVYVLRKSDDNSRSKYGSLVNGLLKKGVSVYSGGKSESGMLVESVAKIDTSSQNLDDAETRKFEKYESSDNQENLDK